jgi:peptidoglycan/LPS O-acetylase OafA/YrhL
MTTSQTMLWPALGGVRFFLAMIVVATHSHDFRVIGGEWRTFLDDMSAFAAVIGFLVISGYSIAASHAKEPQNYYFRRCLRILPLYFLAIAFASVCILPLGGIPTDWSNAAGNLIFLQGIICKPLRTNEVVWTLSIEVFYYLLAPLLARLSTAVLGTVMAAGAVVFVLADQTNPPYPHLQHGSAIAVLAWSWLLGFVAFRLKRAYVAGAVIAAVAGIALGLSQSVTGKDWFVIVAVVAMGIGFGARLNAPTWVSRSFSFLGDLSYPLYLFHYPFFLTYHGFRTPVDATLLIGAVITFAIMLDRYYDKPIKTVFILFDSAIAASLIGALARRLLSSFDFYVARKDGIVSRLRVRLIPSYVQAARAQYAKAAPWAPLAAVKAAGRP